MDSFFSKKTASGKQKISFTQVMVYALAGIYIASSLIGQIPLFMNNALVTVGSAKVTDKDIIKHIQLLPLDPKAQDTQKTYAQIIHTASQMALLDQEVKKLGIHVSTQSAREALAKNPVFDQEKETITAFLSKHHIPLSQAIHYEKRKLAHKRLEQALRSRMSPIPPQMLSLWEKGWCQQRKGIYRAFPVTPKDIDKQTVSKKEIAAYLAKTAMHQRAYRTCTVLALDPKDSQTTQHIQDFAKDSPENLFEWAQKKKLKTYTVQTDIHGNGQDNQAMVLPMLHAYRSIYNDFFFQKERIALAQNIFDHPMRTIFLHEIDKGKVYYIVQATQFVPAKKLSKTDAEKNAFKDIQRQKADEEACKKAEAFAQSASLQGEPITRFGFDTLTVHDIAGNDLLLNDSKASATMNTAFPWVASALFSLNPQENVKHTRAKNDRGHTTFYVVKATEIINPSEKNKLCSPEIQKKCQEAKNNMQKEWRKEMWRSYLLSLAKQYPIHYENKNIASFFNRMNRTNQ